MRYSNKALIAASLGALLLAGKAQAAEATLQEIFNNITQGPVPGVSSVNASLGAGDEALLEGQDAHWMIGGSGGSVTTFVIELSAGAPTQTFGIYDAANAANMVQIFSGGDTAGGQRTVSILADGTVRVDGVPQGVFAGNRFGFYQDTFGNVWRSDTALNSDGFDHMRAYRGEGDTIQILPFAAGPWGPNEYALAWEDISGGGDRDYQDLVVLVESVNPVPEAGSSAMLMGVALAGLGVASRRLQRRQA